MSMELNLEPVPITPHKQDPAWKHCQIFQNSGHRVHIKCMYCDKLFKGGGITRFKEHLAGKKGQGPVCEKVPNDVRSEMRQNLDQVTGKVKKKSRMTREPLAMTSSEPVEKDSLANHVDVGAVYQSIDVSNIVEPCSVFVPNGGEEISQTSSDRRKKRRSSSLSANADEVPKSTLALHSEGKDGQIQVHMAIGRCLFDIQASLETVDSVYFQSMIDAIASGGIGVLPPSHRELQGRILKISVKEVKDDLDQCKSVWAKTGCSILVDQWSSKKGITLLSFLVYCPQGTVFLKSVDVSGIIYSVDSLHDLLQQVVEEVGVRNVVQVITNGDEQYVFVGKRLMESFPSLYWVPCSARCIDMMLEDLGKLEWVNATIEQAKTVTKFIYNNSAVLNMMRRFTFGNDILEPGTTRFASNFTTLQRMADFKLNLQSMVTSQDWLDSEHSKKPGGLAMLNIIGNRSFWNSCILIIRLTHPLLRVLEIVCSKKRPAMGYVYAGIYRAKEAIKRELINRNDYATYWRIIDQRWKQQQHLPLHAAGFFLNPKFFYSIQGDLHNDILSEMFDCIERLVPDTKTQDEIVKEINIYKNAAGDLGRSMAVRARDTMLPGEWWSAYGGGCPNLARLAIRILGQTCGFVGFNPFKISIEQIYETRNCLQRQRLCDLVFVQYNLYLRKMVHKDKEPSSSDPLSICSHSTIDDWITMDDEQPEVCESSDWMSLEPVPTTTGLVSEPINEGEDLGSGFDDNEICDSWKGIKEVSHEGNNRINW